MNLHVYQTVYTNINWLWYSDYIIPSGAYAKDKKNQ